MARILKLHKEEFSLRLVITPQSFTQAVLHMEAAPLGLAQLRGLIRNYID